MRFLILSLVILFQTCAYMRMVENSWNLRQKQERLKREIINNLDFVIGSVTTQGIRGGFNLTTGEKGKTRTKYIRRALLQDVRAMIERHRQLKELLKELSEVNWALLNVRDAG